MSHESLPSTYPPSCRLQLRPHYGISFSLLLLTYINFGWMLATWVTNRGAWVIAICTVLLLSELLASPWSMIRLFSVRWLKSDRRAFITSMLGGVIVVFLLVHLDWLANLLLLMSAGLLVRLDLQMANLSGWKAFWVLLSVAGLGISLGWLAHHAIVTESVLEGQMFLELWQRLGSQLQAFLSQ
jgi:hypothetical protein